MNRPILPIFTLKLVAITTSLEPSERGVRWVKYNPIPTYSDDENQYGTVDPEIA